MNEFKLLFNLDHQENHYTAVRNYLKRSDSCIIVSPRLADDLNKYFYHVYGGKMKHVRLVTTLRGYDWEIAGKIRSLGALKKKCEKNNISLEILINNRLHSRIFLFKSNKEYVSGIISSADLTEAGLNLNIEYGVEILNKAFLGEVERSIFGSFRFEILTDELMEDVINELGELKTGSEGQAAEIDLGRIKRKKKLLAEGEAKFRELIEKTDEYINSLKQDSSRRTVLLFRWNTAPESELTYEEIGILLGITKQRVSEIMIKEIKSLKKYFAPVKEKYEELFLNYLMLNPEPVDLDPGNKSNLYFNSNFYHGLLSEVFDSTPFKDHLNKSFNQVSFSQSRSRTPLERRIFAVIDNLDPGYKEIPIENLLPSYFPDCTDNYSKLMALKMCISSSRFFFNEIDGEIYILEDRRLEEMALEILEKSDIPLSSLEIYKIIGDCYGKAYKTEDTSTVARLSSEGSRIGILRLDADLFGLERHISVARDKWEDIFEAARRVISEKNRQTYVTEIMEEMPADLPEVRSWYELDCILENDKEIHSLGDYYFNLKGRQKRKIEIREAVENILREENRPIGFDELFELVFKRRYATRDGFKSVVEKIDSIVETEGYYKMR